jgi:hypothetical protein
VLRSSLASPFFLMRERPSMPTLAAFVQMRDRVPSHETPQSSPIDLVLMSAETSTP